MDWTGLDWTAQHVLNVTDMFFRWLDTMLQPIALFHAYLKDLSMQPSPISPHFIYSSPVDIKLGTSG